MRIWLTNSNIFGGFDQYAGEMNFHHRKTQFLRICSNLKRHLLYWIIPQLEFIILGILYFLNFIFFIQQVLISYAFYTYQCTYVNPNLPVHHTTTFDSILGCLPKEFNYTGIKLNHRARHCACFCNYCFSLFFFFLSFQLQCLEDILKFVQCVDQNIWEKSLGFT